MAMEIDKEKKKRIAVVSLVIIFILFINCAPKIIYVNITRSLPLGIYLAIPGMNIRRGDIVVYEPPTTVYTFMKEREYGIGNEQFLKRVGAIAGDSYGVIDGVLLINGEKKGLIKEFDSSGNPMPVMIGPHVVPEGQFLPLGDQVNSLDGRYTGPVPVGRIITRVVPVLTEW